MRGRTVFAALLLGVFIAPNTASAQQTVIDAGTRIAEGDVGFSGFSQTGSKGYSVWIGPRLGVFVVRRLAVSSVLTWVHSTVDFDVFISPSPTQGSVRTSSTTWGIGPEVAYYFASIGSRTHLYAAFGASFSWQSTSYRTEAIGMQDSESSSDVVSVMPRLGLLFMLVRNVALNSSVYFRRAWVTESFGSGFGDARTETTAYYGLSVGVSAFLL